MALGRFLHAAKQWLTQSPGEKKAGPRPSSRLGIESLEERALPTTVSIIDPGFEMPAMASGQFVYNPTGSAWSYSGTSGVTGNGSAFSVANAAAPQAGQVAFIQNLGVISQTANFAAGTYDISFLAAQRGNQGGAETFQVLVDGVVVGSFNSVAGNTYSVQTTSAFTVAAGNHTVTFKGTNLNGGDSTVFLDQFAINQRAVALNDSGFESVVLSSKGYSYNPTGSVWTFNGTTGLTTNGSAFTVSNPNAPDASQVAFLQSQGSISQTAYFYSDGTYEISFAAAQRLGQASTQTFKVLVDGYVVGTFNNLNGDAYSQLATTSFSVATGYHTITFQGTNLNGGDNTVFLDQISVVPQTSSLTDSGFEYPALAVGAFAYTPTNAAWTYSGTSGIATNNSAFTSGNSAAAQGNQVAFLQSQSSISQSVYFNSGTYSLSFAVAQRGNQASNQTFQVLVDGTVVGTYNNVTGNVFNQLTTSNFTLSTGVHTITFQGTNLNGGDNTVFIDQVTVIQQATGLSDSGFESLVLGTGSFSYKPTGSPWTFTGNSGITTNSSGFTSANPVAPQAAQVAFLQTQGAISQTAYYDAGTYDISFIAAQRSGQSSTQTFQVLVDGTVVGTFNNLVGAAYTELITSSFTLAAGIHTVTFQGTNIHGGDNTVFLDQVTANLQSASLNDNGFEMPALTAGAYSYNPTNTYWAYGGTAGVASNGSAFTASNPDAPQASQVAFLQTTGTISQTAYFTTGTYNLYFAAAQRSGQSSTQTFQVVVDGVVIGVYNTLYGNTYSLLATSSFTLSAGFHTVTFQGTNLNGGDNTVFLDQVFVSKSDSGFSSNQPAALLG